MVKSGSSDTFAPKPGPRIWLSPPEVTGPDRDRLLAAIDDGWIAPVGPDLDAYEVEVAAACGRKHGVGLASGTAALHLLLKEMGVGPGDEVIVSSFTFAASANAVSYLGATPVFIDAEPPTWQMSPSLLADELEDRRRGGRAAPKAAIVVDLYGQCADYDELIPLLDEHGVILIEDAAEALGATYRGRPAGSFGTAAVVSFNGNKIITTSGGGMAVTDDEFLAERCRHMATQAREPFPHYEHLEVGYNYRLSNLLAAFGRGQLSDLGRRVVRRREINHLYREALADVEGVAFMPEAAYGVPTCWLSCITIDSSLGVSPEQVRVFLDSWNIEARPTWKPMHRQPVYSGAPRRLDGTSDRLFATGLCLPSGSSLQPAEQERVIDFVRHCIVD